MTCPFYSCLIDGSLTICFIFTDVRSTSIVFPCARVSIGESTLTGRTCTNPNIHPQLVNLIIATSALLSVRRAITVHTGESFRYSYTNFS